MFPGKTKHVAEKVRSHTGCVCCCRALPMKKILTPVVHSWTSYPGRFLSSL